MNCRFCCQDKECFPYNHSHLCLECMSNLDLVRVAVEAAVCLSLPRGTEYDVEVRLSNHSAAFLLRSKSAGFRLGMTWFLPRSTMVIFTLSQRRSEFFFEESVRRCVEKAAETSSESLVRLAARSDPFSAGEVARVAEAEGEFRREFVDSFVRFGILKMEIEL